ncbi:MAG: AHH domain-containing protein [Deltaproteobacteria bacterium]|nr:AHH domain-containing protein [Deltaproteobacteria bacterium]
MQIGEEISDSLKKEYDLKCPFNEDEPGGPEAGTEDISEDDKASAEEAQKNDGGILGTNLMKGKKGKADGGPYPPDDYLVKMKPNDTKREGRNPKIHIPGYRDAKEGDFSFVVAAHHLIPGNASLKRAKKLVRFMTKGDKVKSTGRRTYTIKYHIGYDINGAHNGVWLPANYAIKTALPEKRIKRKNGKVYVRPARDSTTPVKDVSWAKLRVKHKWWQLTYVAGTCKAIGAQFHDTHTRYNKHVLTNLNKISTALAVHLDCCDICKEEGKKEIPPPYRIKRRLFGFSKRLRYHLLGNTPAVWKRTLLTSDRWAKHYFSGGKKGKFRRASAGAKLTVPERPLPN